MTIRAKICGVTTIEAASAAINDSADYLGFIHFPKSPRHLPLNAMADLMSAVRRAHSHVQLVSVVVDPSDELLQSLARDVRPDVIQLHGHEPVERVAEVKARYALPVIKVISVETAGDVTDAVAYEAVADFLMFESKPPKGAALPGGLGLSFDWPLMKAWTGAKPWFLAGGLNPANVAEALRLSGAPMVDVSSGVEMSPGVKDIRLISSFLKAVKLV